MDRKPIPEKRHRPPLAALVFCAALAAGLLGLIFVPKIDYSPLEKRYLADAPALTAETLFDGSFGDDFEEYLSRPLRRTQLFRGLLQLLFPASGK